MVLIRSILMNIFFFSWLLILLLFLWVPVIFGRPAVRETLRWWSRTARAGLHVFGGIRAEFRGLENLPKGPALIVSKHQSIWDTFIFYLLLDDPQYVLKQELSDLPVWGFYAMRSGHIAVDRTAGAKALRGMAEDAAARLAAGRQVIIFPEGTRMPPGESRRYHPGVAALYAALPEGVPAVPVALNSGTYWGRRKFFIKPGTIVLSILEPIPPGLDRKKFMALLEERIETETHRLEAAVDG